MRLIPTLIAVAAIGAHVGAVKAADDVFYCNLVAEIAENDMNLRQMGLPLEYSMRLPRRETWQYEVMYAVYAYPIQEMEHEKVRAALVFRDKIYQACLSNPRTYGG